MRVFWDSRVVSLEYTDVSEVCTESSTWWRLYMFLEETGLQSYTAAEIKFLKHLVRIMILDYQQSIDIREILDVSNIYATNWKTGYNVAE
jgi:hypothetical protein